MTCLDMGEASHYIAMFLTASAFRKAILEKKVTMGDLDEAI